MGMWIAILFFIIAVTVAALWQICRGAIRFFAGIRGRDRLSRNAASGVILSVLTFFTVLALFLRTINAVIIFCHLAAIWLLADLLFGLSGVLLKRKPARIPAAVLAFSVTVFVLSSGWYQAHHVSGTEYHLVSTKRIPDLRILLIADAHVGSTFDAAGFGEHLSAMEREHPDLILIAGDYVDDDTSREDMEQATAALGRLRPPLGIYFVFGNHDRGYYGSARRGFDAEDLKRALRENGITVLEDEIAEPVPWIAIAGRKDLSVKREKGGERASLSDLLPASSPDRYCVVMDHQPAAFIETAAAGADLAVSGHTHGGQLFPFNKAGLYLGAVDAVYGHSRIGGTDFIVTSGIFDWAIRFKTGTFSEYAVINVTGKKD